MRAIKNQKIILLCLLIASFILSACSSTQSEQSFVNITTENSSEIIVVNNINGKNVTPPTDNASTTKLNIDICEGSEPLTLCGMDGKTYSSECKLFQMGTKVNFIGSCDSTKSLISGTNCTDERNVVCGFKKSFSSYKNSCLAQFYNASVKHAGPCNENDVVVCADNSPVCGINNITYGGECAAIAHNTTVAYVGKCIFPNKK